MAVSQRHKVLTTLEQGQALLLGAQLQMSISQNAWRLESRLLVSMPKSCLANGNTKSALAVAPKLAITWQSHAILCIALLRLTTSLFLSTRSPRMAIGMALGVTRTFPSKRCARKEAMKLSPRCARLSARKRKSISQNTEKVTISASQASMRHAASMSSSMALPIAVHLSAFLALPRRKEEATWKTVALPPIVMHTALQLGSFKQQASAWKAEGTSGPVLNCPQISFTLGPPGGSSTER